MTTIRWTNQAIADPAAIRAFIEQDSPHYASVVVARLIRAVDQLKDFPQSGRVVPEFERKAVREIVERPYPSSTGSETRARSRFSPSTTAHSECRRRCDAVPNRS